MLINNWGLHFNYTILSICCGSLLFIVLDDSVTVHISCSDRLTLHLSSSWKYLFTCLFYFYILFTSVAWGSAIFHHQLLEVLCACNSSLSDLVSYPFSQFVTYLFNDLMVSLGRQKCFTSYTLFIFCFVFYVLSKIPCHDIMILFPVDFITSFNL